MTQGLLRPVSTRTRVKRLESPHFSTLLHHLFKVQELSVSCQRVEACLQTIVEHNPWFPHEGSFDLEIWHRVKKNVERATRWRKNIPIDFWPLWALIQAVILPFQGRSAAPAKSLQSCPTLCDPIDGRPPGSPVPGILQGRTLEWVAIAFSFKAILALPIFDNRQNTYYMHMN